VIGEPLYMAYLLNLVTLKDNERKLLVDHETKIEAEGKISFIQYKNPVFQNKLSHGIFEPILSLGPLKPLPYNAFPDVRTHHFNMDYTTMNTQDDYIDSMFMVGRDAELKARVDMLAMFLRAPQRSNLLVVGGNYGSGKSLFVRNFLERAAELTQDSYESREKAIILTSCLNPYTRMLKLNGWRNVMREILNIMAF
jgi:hypothetical protein